jgi:hypothetical protein
MNRHPVLTRSLQRRLWPVFLVVLASCGCGGNKEGKVSGTVTYQGQPLPYGNVTFVDSSNHLLASSVINKGNYAMGKVPVGPVKITVTTPADPSKTIKKSSPEMQRKVARRPNPIAIPAKYGNPDQAGLTYTVQPGKQEHNINLE